MQNKEKSQTMEKFRMFGSFESPKPSNPALLTALKKKCRIICLEVNVIQKRLYVHFEGKKKIIDMEIETGLIGVGVNNLENSTPLGEFLTSRKRVRGIRQILALDQQTPVLTRTEPKTNLGAGFIGFDAVDENGINRGIGFHGSETNKLTETNGCIRMYNDDVLVLLKMLLTQTTLTPPVVVHS